MAERVLANPLSGLEIRNAILDKISRRLESDCYLSSNLSDGRTNSRPQHGDCLHAFRANHTGDMTLSGPQINAWWFDPRTGKATSAGTFAANGTRQFTPPGQQDWVLVLDDASKHLPSPGQ